MIWQKSRSIYDKTHKHYRLFMAVWYKSIDFFPTCPVTCPGASSERVKICPKESHCSGPDGVANLVTCWMMPHCRWLTSSSFQRLYWHTALKMRIGEHANPGMPRWALIPIYRGDILSRKQSGCNRLDIFGYFRPKAKSGLAGDGSMAGKIWPTDGRSGQLIALLD